MTLAILIALIGGVLLVSLLSMERDNIEQNEDETWKQIQRDIPFIESEEIE